jgi:hypothetical protein
MARRNHGTGNDASSPKGERRIFIYKLSKGGMGGTVVFAENVVIILDVCYQI